MEQQIDSTEEVIDEEAEGAESETTEQVNWEDRARKLESKAIASREKRKAEKDAYERTIADLKTQIPTQDKKAQPDDSNLLQKAFLRTAGISGDEEVELALSTAKKWDMEVDKLVDDDDFKLKLEKHRQSKANLAATSNVRGDGTGSSAKNTPEYWLAKGQPPTPDEVPDAKARRKIVRAFMKDEGGSGKFYNS